MTPRRVLGVAARADATCARSVVIAADQGPIAFSIAPPQGRACWAVLTIDMEALLLPMHAPRERRRQPRYNIHPTVRFSFGGGPRLAAHCRDISLGGAFLETDTPPLFGSTVRIHFWLPTTRGQVHVVIDSVVRWTNRDGFGVQFGSMGARETHALVSLFHRAVGTSESRRRYFRTARARVRAYRREIRALARRG